MKFKYYLRGLSVGILITVIILAVSSAFRKEGISDDEIIARAKELGMVMAEEEDKIPSRDSEEEDLVPATEEEGNLPENSSQDSSQSDTLNGTLPKGDTQITQTEFTVEVGESSNQVAKKLAELGLVDDAEVFNQYMVDNQYDSFVLPGTITIPQGADYETIAGLLVDKTIER